MAIQDTPIETTKPTVQDTPIDIEVSSEIKSEARDRFEATQAAFLDNYLTGTGVLEAFDKYVLSPNKDQILNQLSSQKTSQDIDAIEEEFLTNPYGETGSIEETAKAVFLARMQAAGKNTDPDKHFAEAISGDKADGEALDREAARAKMFKILSDWEEDIGASDYIMDIAAGFVPFLESYKGYKLTGTYFGQDEEIQKAIAKFQTLPIQEQAEIFPQLISELKDKVGDLEGFEIAQNFLKPLGAEESENFSDAWKIFDALDAAGIGSLIKGALKSVKRSYNLVKSAKSLGNDELAVDATIAAAVDEDYAKAAGMDSTTATGNALPFDISLEDPGYTSGLSSKVQESLKEYFGRVDKTAEDIIQGNGFLKEGILNTSKRAELEEAAYSKLQAERAEDIKIKSKDLNQTVFEYKIVDEDGNISNETYTLDLTLNDAGHYEQSTVSILAEYGFSPSAFAKATTLAEDVETAQRLDYLDDRIRSQLLTLTRDALKPIGLFPTPKNKKSLAKVDKALVEGDEWKNPDGTRGKVFKPDELREMFGLEDNEINAYYRINRLYNNLFNIRNHEVRQEKVARGFKYVNLPRTEEGLSGKVYDTHNDAIYSLRKDSTNYIYDADADKLISIKNKADSVLEDEYALGERLVKVEQPYDIGGDRGKVLYILSHESDIEELPQIVLNRKAGYVPRIYEDNAYFVKELIDTVVDGDKPWTDTMTLRFFSNKKEADEFVESLIAKGLAEAGDASPATLEKLEKDLRKRYTVLSDREAEILSSAVGEYTGKAGGGLYTGARAQDDILFGLEGTKPVRLNSFESLIRNITNVSRFASINQWRLGLEQRWINTANEIFKAKGLNISVDKFDRLSTIAEIHDEVRFLNRLYDQIRDWQGFPTLSERTWSSLTQKLYDAAANRGFKRTQKILGSLRSKDPIALARAASFHSLLGWFNFSQLWVQMQGISIAASLAAGKYLTNVLRESLALATLDVGGDALTKKLDLVAKAAGISKEELQHLHKLWVITGYKDSVKQSADYAAVSKGYGMSSEILKRAADSGLIFYRAGELTNRRVSFLTSVKRWLEKEGNAGKSIMDIGEEDLKKIMNDANNMMLNMSKANRAWWQKGVLSLPTQFWQVTTKFLETATGLNGHFKPGERGRMIAAQIALYGTAGIPIAGLTTKMALEAFGVTQKDIEENPGLVKLWNDGFWGATAYWIFDADIELSSRGSLLRGISETLDNWFVQESTVQEKLLGAFGTTSTRFFDSLVKHARPFFLSEYEVDWKDVGALLTSPFLDTVSTWTNQEKAAFMERMDAVYSRTGRLVVSKDFSFAEELAMRIGFQPTVVAETWDLIDRNSATEGYKKKITDYILTEMNSFALEFPDGDYTEEAFAKHKAKISAALASLDPDEQQAVREAMLNSINSESRRSQASRAYIKNLKERAADDLLLWKSTALGNKVLRLGVGSEEE